jgi:hypothetical protein
MAELRGQQSHSGSVGRFLGPGPVNSDLLLSGTALGEQVGPLDT